MGGEVCPVDIGDSVTLLLRICVVGLTLDCGFLCAFSLSLLYFSRSSSACRRMSPLSARSSSRRAVSGFVTLVGAADDVLGLEFRHGLTGLCVMQVLVPGRETVPDGALDCCWLKRPVTSAGATFSSLYGRGAEATENTEAGETCLGRVNVEVLRETADKAEGLDRGSSSRRA